MRSGTNGNLPAIPSPRTRCRARACVTTIGRDRREEFVDEDVAGSRPRRVRGASRDAEARRHDARAVAGVDAFVSPSTTRSPTEVAAQRRGAPELIVVAALGIEAYDETRRADPASQLVDVGGQVVAAAFFAGLDQHDAARVRDLLLLQQADRGQRSERARIRRRRRRGRTACRRESRAPTVRGRRYQPPNSGCLSRCPYISTQCPRRPRHVDHADDRRAAVEPHHFDLGAGRRLRRAQRTISTNWTAASMCPCASQSGSKSGDLFGMRT